MRIALCLAFCSIFAFAQQPLDNQAVVALLRDGTPVATVCRMIRTAPNANFNIAPANTEPMVIAGVPEEVIKAMAYRQAHGPVTDSGAGISSATSAPPVSTAAAAESSADPAPAESTAPPAAPKTASHPSFSTPVVSLFGGYSYVSVDSNGAGRQGASGFESSVAFMFNRWAGVDSDFGAYFRDYSILDFTTIKGRDYSFGAGPRVNVGPGFFHVMVGEDHLSGSADLPSPVCYGLACIGAGPLSASQNSLATFIGGGVQVKMPHSSHLALRFSADYVITQHSLYGAPLVQNNIRFSTGLVYVAGPDRAASW